MSRILFSADDLPVYRRGSNAMSVVAFESGTVLLSTEGESASSMHHLTPVGARALAAALLTAALAVDLETADARRAEAA